MSPYRKPRQTSKGFVLPKKEGGVHRSSSGKVVRFKSAAKAKNVGRYVMALEHGMVRKPRKVV